MVVISTGIFPCVRYRVNQFVAKTAAAAVYTNVLELYFASVSNMDTVVDLLGMEPFILWLPRLQRREYTQVLITTA